MKMFALIAVLLCSSMTYAAEAQPAPQPAAVAALGAAPSEASGTLTLSAEDLTALLTAAKAKAEQPAPKAAVITAEGVLGFSWQAIGGLLGTVALFAFGFWKTTTGTRVKKLVEDAIAAAWWVAERNGQDYEGVMKAAIAMQALYENLAQKKIPLDPNIGAQAAVTWKAMSAKAGVEMPATFEAPSAKDIAEAKARAEAAKDVANAGKTATDIANEAAK